MSIKVSRVSSHLFVFAAHFRVSVEVYHSQLVACDVASA